jgi:SAM-dependent methyltransferase
MDRFLWRLIKSFAYRSGEFAYRIFPKRATLAFYCYLTYILRAVTWRLACKYYGSSMAERRGDMSDFVLSQIGPEMSVIDIGCAEGNLTRLIAGKAKKVVAVEIDKKYLDMIDQNDSGFSNVRFINGDILNLTFEEIFDAAVLIHAIEHMENAGSVLKKISDIAKTIIIETPDQESDWLSNTLIDLGIDERGDDKHVKMYDAASLREEMELNGWKDVVISKGNGVVRAVACSKLNNVAKYAHGDPISAKR